MNKIMQQVQKQYGIKLGKYDTDKNRLFNMGLLLLKSVEEYIKQVEDAELTDEQFFIDWEIDLSNLSTKDHNKTAESK